MIPWKFEWKLWRKPGRGDLLGRAAAARDVAGLEHEHPLARLREVARAGEAVVASADDDDVVASSAISSPRPTGAAPPRPRPAARRPAGCSGRRGTTGRGRGVDAALDQAADVRRGRSRPPRRAAAVLLEPEVRRVDRLLVHAPEDLGAQVLQPVRVQVHDPELAQRLDVDDRRDEGVVAGRAVGDDVAQVVDDVGVAAADVVRVLHPRMEVDGADVGAEHVDAVEVGVGAVLEHPRAAAG